MGQKVIVLVGATGSGKTGVAIEIAKEVEREKLGGFLGAEIIAADSRTIYKGMDVGTAKPSLEEREGIVHHGFDLVEPGERFTVADWKKFADKRIAEIGSRGKLPMVVGGTGLYVDALVYDYQFTVPSKGYGRERGECIKKLYNDDKDFEQERMEREPDRQKICSKYKMFGIWTEPEELRTRLAKRAEEMFDEELFEETGELVGRYGREGLGARGNIYEIAWKYLEGEITREEAVRLAAVRDAQLAKRQRTWFRRNRNITWLSLEKIKPAVIKCIQDD